MTNVFSYKFEFSPCINQVNGRSLILLANQTQVNIPAEIYPLSSYFFISWKSK